MNKYVKSFLLRGLCFSGLGCVVVGIVYAILQASNVDIVLNGFDVFKAILTGYVIAFVHAGSTTFPQIDSWSKPKAMGIMFLCLYTVYTVGYLINGWLKFDWLVVGIYTCCFIVGYIIIWAISYFPARKLTNHLNQKLEAQEKAE